MRFIIILLCLGSIFFAKAEDLAVGFIYKKNIPEEALYLFDWLVVDPDNFTMDMLKEKFYIKKKKAKLIAYVSVGELEPYRDYYKKADKSWIIGENKGWNSKIADLRKKEYIDFLFDNRFNVLRDYDGFFLDTLDSYQIVLKTEKERVAYEEGLVNLIKRLRKTYPDKIIIINRGFEIVDRVKSDANALVAESLFYGLDVGKEIKYKKMKPEDTEWLLNKLNYTKSLGLKVIVIDYVDPKNRKLQEEVARMIYEKGFIPYVADKMLNSVGVSLYQIKPRKVLLLYNKKEQTEPAYTDIHRLVQPWIEFIGYVPVLRDIDTVLDSSEFNSFIADEYIGIVSMISDYNNPSKLLNWLLAKREEGIKLVFINQLPFPDSDEYLSKFGLSKVGRLSFFDEYKVVESSFEFFETQPRFEEITMLDFPNPEKFMKVASNGKTFYPMAITDWGAYALYGSFLSYLADDAMFVLNPIEFFWSIFKPDFPIPDTTTENGRRILTAHIDGDAAFGVADFDTSKNVMEVFMEEILEKFPIPHTISIIEGEIAPYGLYPEKSTKLQQIVRKMFSYENVEIASHSFSHPYKWQKIEKASKLGEKAEGYNLPIKNYTFNLEREIHGSVEYINKNLAPKGKKTDVFLWTGDCVPSTNALKLTYKLGIYNVNGGYTWINKKEPFYSLVSSMGLDRDGYFQVYPPVQNENIYTNLWRDYYGYKRAIETFDMTENPIRLKSISIYYHFYSTQKIAALKALKEVYQYALSKPVNPMFLSEFAQRVLEFRNMAIAKDIRDGNLVIRSEGNLRTVRFDKGEVYPDIFKSKGVVGFNKHGRSMYIHLDNSGDYKIILSNKIPDFYLVDSNGQILDFKVENEKIYIKLKSYLPIEYTLYIGENCKVKVYPEVEPKKDGNHIRYYNIKSKESHVETSCKS